MRRIMKCLVGLALLMGMALGISSCGDLLSPGLNDFGVTASPSTLTFPDGLVTILPTGVQLTQVTLAPAGRFSDRVQMNAFVQPTLPSQFFTFFEGIALQAGSVFIESDPVTVSLKLGGPIMQPVPPGIYTITITGTATKTQLTHSVTFQLIEVGGSALTISTISPTSQIAGSPGFPLTVNGSGFTASSVVNWNGSARSTTFVSGSQLTAQITTADVSAAGTASVTVVNPGGLVSNAVSFTINPSNSPVLAITVLNPNSAVVGSPGFSLQVQGTGFVQSSIVQWNGSNRTTHFVSPTEVDADIPATDLAAPGSASVTVLNPTPGGGTSNALPFTISPIVPGVFALLSASVNNPSSATANGPSEFPASSLDGRFIAFQSKATDLINPASSSAAFLVYLRDTCLGVSGTCTPGVALVSTSNAETPDGDSTNPAISGDGRFVAFETLATNLCSIDNFEKICRTEMNGLTFVRTELISLNNAGGAANSASQNPAISADGRFVAFQSTATNLDFRVSTTNPGSIFLRDTCFGVAGCSTTTTLLSVDNNGNPANALSDMPSVSADGRFVAFESNATNLVPGINDGLSHIYLRDSCTGPTVVLPCTLSTIHVSADIPGQMNSQSPSVSSDGRFVAFSSAHLFNGFDQVYVYDTCGQPNAPIPGCTPSTTLVSVQLNNAAPDGFSLFPSISADGRFVGYTSSATQQVANDSNGVPDAFVRDTCIGADASCTPQTVRLSVKTDGTQGNSDSAQVSIAGNGQAAAFASSASNLIANDNNGTVDVFLALTGFSQPAVVPAISVLQPPNASHGGGDFVLTVTGSLFNPGAQVLWNGSPRDTTYINHATLEVFIPASDIPAAGAAQISVVNPAPGGQSNTVTFTIN